MSTPKIEIREVKKCCVCKENKKRLHDVELKTCASHSYRTEYLCCKCTNRLENWLDGRRMRYDN